eukprot:10920696-Alexandrium_andersonii.AAC.1
MLLRSPFNAPNDPASMVELCRQHCVKTANSGMRPRTLLDKVSLRAPGLQTHDVLERPSFALNFLVAAQPETGNVKHELP